MKCLLTTLLLSAALLALNSCGGSGGSSSECKGATVEYSVDCETGPVCLNTSSIKQDLSGMSKYATCVWWCATYENTIETHVTVNFSKTGSGCWQEDGVVVTGGKPIEITPSPVGGT
jgi:hypothetical protein